MTTLSKTATLSSLGLPTGDHVLRLHVERDVISFEIEPQNSPQTVADRKPIGFVKKWGGSGKKQEDATDLWLTHINEKHLR